MTSSFLLATLDRLIPILFCRSFAPLYKMEAQIARKQDLPPPGGYKPIPYKRIPAKQYFSGFAMFAGYIGLSIGGLYVYYLTDRKIKKQEIEMRSAKMAIYPMLLAERDREYLKQIRRNRDAEAELMRDVPGWEYFTIEIDNLTRDYMGDCLGFTEYIMERLDKEYVGTYYGERVYKLVPPDTLIEPIFHEYYAHSEPREWYKRAHIKLWS